MGEGDGVGCDVGGSEETNGLGGSGFTSTVPLPRCESMMGRESGMGGGTASKPGEEVFPCEEENLDILLAIENLEYR